MASQNSKKNCQFRKDTVVCVGHQITKDCLKADPEKVRAIKDISTPTYVKELQKCYVL